MFLKLFRGTGPGVVLLIFLTAAGIWIAAFLDPQKASSFLYDVNPMPLYAIMKSLLGESSLVGIIFSFIVLLLISLLIVNFNTSVFFINERTFIPAIIYILLSGMFPQYQTLNPVLPAAFFLMLAIRRIMEAYRKTSTAFNFFDAALLISTGSLFYANMIWFGILVIIGIAILRTSNVKEIMLALLGLVTPLILTASVWYVTGLDMSRLADIAIYNLFEKAGSNYFSTPLTYTLIFVGIVTLVSLWFLLTVVYSKKIKSRKTFIELIWILVIALTVYLAVPSASFELVYLISIPLCYLIAHYFLLSRRKVIPELFFTLMFICVILIQVISRI